MRTKSKQPQQVVPRVFLLGEPGELVLKADLLNEGRGADDVSIEAMFSQSMLRKGTIVLVINRRSVDGDQAKSAAFGSLDDVNRLVKPAGMMAQSISLKAQLGPADTATQSDDRGDVVGATPTRRRKSRRMPKTAVPEKPVKIPRTTLEEIRPKLEAILTSGALQSHGIPPDTARNFGREFENLFLLVTASKRRIKSLPMMEKTKRRVEEVLKQINPLLELGGMKFDAATKTEPSQKGGVKKEVSKEALHKVLTETSIRSLFTKYGLPKKLYEKLSATRGIQLHVLGNLAGLTEKKLLAFNPQDTNKKIEKSDIGEIKAALGRLSKEIDMPITLGMDTLGWEEDVPHTAQTTGGGVAEAADAGRDPV